LLPLQPHAVRARACIRSGMADGTRLLLACAASCAAGGALAWTLAAARHDRVRTQTPSQSACRADMC
jgi:hypothetical protein